MRFTLFHEPVLQPGDDLYNLWIELFDEDPEGLYARFIQEEAPDRWGCELADVTREVQVDDFESEAQLRDWLYANRVPVEEDTDR